MFNSGQIQAASRTFALIVGVEKYDLGENWNLEGCIDQAKRFQEWLVVSNKVDDKNIFLHLAPLSPVDQGSAHAADLTGITESLTRLRNREPKDRFTDVLLFYWAGHGYAREKERRLYYANSAEIQQSFSFDAHFESLASEQYRFRWLFAFVDACASKGEEERQLPAVQFPEGCKRDWNAGQYAYFACRIGESAGYQNKMGLFSKELFGELENCQLPLELTKLDVALGRRFKELRAKNQNPWRLWIKNPSGENFYPEPGLSNLVQSYLDKVEKQFEELKEEIFPLTTQPGKMKPLPRPLHKERNVLEELRRQGLLPDTSGRRPSDYPTLDDTVRPEKIPHYLATYGRVVLLGSPGAGKSTLLHYLFYQFARFWQETAEDNRTALPKEYKDRIPVFVSLKHWKDREMDFITFLKEHVKTIALELAEHLPTLMEKGQVVLLLDGLNEMPQLKRDTSGHFMEDRRAKAIAELGNEKRFLPVWCVLSCRDKEFVGPQWNDLHVLNLNPEQIRNFVVSMCPDHHDDAQAFLNELDKSTDPFKQKLRDLASSPFYLKIALAYYFETNALAASRWTLLTFTVETALRREVEGRELTEDERNELNSRLSLLAFNMTDAEYVGGVDQEQATRWMFNLRDEETSDHLVEHTDAPTGEELSDAEDLWRWAKGTGLIYVTPEGVSFYHQLFQEYFCARYCSRDTFQFAGMLQRMTYPAFLEVWPLLAEWDNNLVEKLSKLLLDKAHGKDAVHALSMIGDDEAVRALIAVLSDSRDNIRKRAIETLVTMGSSVINLAIESLTTTAENDPDGQVRRAAKKAIKQIELENASR